MKNNLFFGNMEKLVDGDERMFTYNDVLELITVNKMQRGHLDEFVEGMVTDAGSEYDETENNNDDACNLPDIVIDTTQRNATANNWNKFLCAGYTDCMDEAIRYLVEVENISPEQPVVQNLKTHLQESKERILDEASHFNCRPIAQNECRPFSTAQDANPFSSLPLSRRLPHPERDLTQESSFSHQYLTNYEFLPHNCHLHSLHTIVKLLMTLQTCSLT